MASTSSIHARFTSHNGQQLSARIDLPAGPLRAMALFAHCFTCTKDNLAARRIASGLATAGIGVMRFDFTGLGASEGDFANTNFSSNVDDLVAAADYLRDTYDAPAVLIGHSLGGAAVLVAASRIPEAKAVVTIAAPADVGEVLRHFGSSLDEIRDRGEARVTLADQKFTLRRQFVEDAESQKLADHIHRLDRALLVMHAPFDQVVGIDNASRIFLAARHPKSFVSLDDADHLLSGADAAGYAAGVIVAWAERYIPHLPAADAGHDHVLVRETGNGRFQNIAVSGRHRLLADEPRSVGGLDSGPSPYDYLSIALGACTAMTLRIYAEHKKIDLGRISVEVRHGKVTADHCDDCGEVAKGRHGKIDRFERIVRIEGNVDPAMADKVVEIAGKCPVHRTLEHTSAVVTSYEHD